ncbi:growth hormone secretagogue receptor type 1 [Sergentomyia squamirostris]
MRKLINIIQMIPRRMQHLTEKKSTARTREKNTISWLRKGKYNEKFFVENTHAPHAVPNVITNLAVDKFQQSRTLSHHPPAANFPYYYFLRPTARKSDGFIQLPAEQQVQVHPVEIQSETPHGFATFNETAAVENSTLARLINNSIHSVVVHDNFTQNATDYFGQPQIPAYIRTTAMVFCILILCLGVIGNIMVPIVILKTKDMRNSTNIFLTNLSIADLLVLLVCTPTVLVEVNTPPETWVLGQEMCKAVPFVELTVAHASVLTILAISFERYYAICEPLKAGYVCTKARAILICITAWIVAALFTSPILLVAEYKNMDYVDGSRVAVCLTQASNPWTISFFLMIISVFFILPLMVLIILYSIIAKNLISNDISMLKLRPSKSELSHKARKKVVMIIATVVIAHFSCLLPFRILTLWIVIAPDEHVKGVSAERYYNVLFFSRIMLYLNSAINPILYNLMSSKFRKGFTRLFHCTTTARVWCNRTRQQTTPTNTTTTTTSSFLAHSVNSRKSSSSCYRTTLSMDDVRIRNGSVCRWGNEGPNDNATNDDVCHDKRVIRQSSTPFLTTTTELQETIVIRSIKHQTSLPKPLLVDVSDSGALEEIQEKRRKMHQVMHGKNYQLIQGNAVVNTDKASSS